MYDSKIQFMVGAKHLIERRYGEHGKLKVLAIDAGVKPSSISTIMTGNYAAGPGPEVQERLAKALGSTVYEIIGMGIELLDKGNDACSAPRQKNGEDPDEGTHDMQTTTELLSQVLMELGRIRGEIEALKKAQERAGMDRTASSIKNTS